MCQFCVQHGEGKKWYLAMKNYSHELLHAELSASQQEIIGATTRVEAAVHVFEDLIIPAITGVPKPESASAKTRPRATERRGTRRAPPSE